MATVEEAKTTSGSADEEVLQGLVAEYADPAALIEAAEKVRDAGYKNWDAHSPFPVHGIDDAMGIKRTKLPYIVGCCAFAGFCTGFLLQWATNGWDYPLILSGKDPFTLQSSVPVMFELSVLFSAFGALLGMLGLNGLPRFSQPIFKVEDFAGATDDKFFIVIEAKDPQFDEDKVETLLKDSGSTKVQPIMACTKEAAIPKPILMGMALVMLISLAPLLLILRARYVTYDYAKIHIVQDMDAQPKWKAQTKNKIFADLRTERPDIAGTIARGELEYMLDPKLYAEGTESDSITQWVFPPKPAAPAGGDDKKPEDKKADGGAQVGTVKVPVGAEGENKKAPADDKKEAAPADAGGAGDPPRVEKKAWVTEFPMPVTAELMKRGQQRFNIYCTVCHGYDGAGGGTAAVRGSIVSPQTWSKPIGLTTQGVVDQDVGRLYETITKGRGKMPPYAAQIPFEDRWAIVLYLRALQRSQNASEADYEAAQQNK